MAEAELSIEYRDIAASTIYVVSAILWPVSIMLLLWSSMVLIIAALNGNIQGGPTFLLMTLNALLVVLCGFIVFLASDRTIFITRDGLAMPFFVCIGPWLRVRKK